MIVRCYFVMHWCMLPPLGARYFHWCRKCADGTVSLWKWQLY